MKSKIFKDQKLDEVNVVNVLIIVLIIGAVFGFFWETCFYRFSLGYFIKRGTSYGPIVPIYGFGAVSIVVLTYRYRENPWLIFFINTLSLGTLEYVTGWVLYEFLDKRLWDYNTEIWNFGNLHGFVCARSIAAFGFAGLFLIYFLLPQIFKLVKRIPEKRMTIICFSILSIFVTDIFTYIFLNF